MSVLIVCDRLAGLRFGNRAAKIALDSDSPLIRCAAQSAEIYLQFIPHTFSV